MTRDRRCLRLKSGGIVFARRMRVGLIDSLKFPVVDYDYRYDWILENTHAHTHTLPGKQSYGIKGKMRAAKHGVKILG